MKELVSIVMPVYNSEEYLEEAVESCLTQTYQNIEIIAVNDGSTDSSQEILERLAMADHRIKILKQANEGSASARNVGIKSSKGDLIALLDSDDIMFPERIEIQKSFLDKHPDIHIVSSLANYIDRDNRVIGRNYTYINSIADCVEHIRNDKIIFCLQSGILMRKMSFEQVGGYQNDLRYAQDIDLINRMVEGGLYLIVLPKILVSYRIHNQSVMSKFNDRIIYFEYVKAMATRRRKNVKEMTFKEYEKKWNTKPFYYRLTKYMDHWGVHIYRSAGLMFSQKRYIRFFLYLSIAFLIKPAYTTRKIIYQKFFR